MPLIADVETARQRRDVLAVPDYTRTSREEDNYFVTMYFGAPPSTVAGTIAYDVDDTSLPQAYLVEQPAGSTIPAHYHDTDQYQVFIHGNARFGKKPIGPVTVHFAGGHTPYGPILTENEATHFFTFRAHWDGGGKPMPENRANLARVKRIYRLAAGHQPEVSGGEPDTVIATEDNGLGTAIFHLASGQQQTLDLEVRGGGQYLLVLDGSVRHAATELGKHSCLFRYPEEAPVQFTAGEQGASVMLLQFPQQESLDTLSTR
jgi:hypothetical protein